MRELPQRLTKQPGFHEAIAALEAGKQASFDGAWGSACALLAAQLERSSSGPFVVVCPFVGDIDDFCADLKLFSGAVIEPFPAREADPNDHLLQDESYGQRLRIIKDLLTDRSPRVLVTSIQSLLQPLPPRSIISNNTRRLAVGRSLEADALLKWLVEQRFNSTSAVQLPGEFSVRGGVIDIFAADWQQPVRIELFGDEIDSIRRFDVVSQRSLETLDEVELTVLQPTADQHEALTAYLPASSWFMLLEPDVMAEEGKHFLERQERPGDYHTVASMLGHISRFAVATAAALPRGAAGIHCSLKVESVERFSGDISRVRDELDRIGEGQEVFVVVQTEAEAERLQEVFAPSQLAVKGRLHFPLGSLREGFRLVRERVVLVSGNQLFHRSDVRRLPRRRIGKPIDSFLDLRKGDLVVHLSHGIARYRGIKLLEKEKQVEEHLELEFHGGTKVFVPASKIGLVQKYVGGTKARPALGRIGGKTWVRQKQAAQAAVLDMAAEMLELQAARGARPGISFGEDSEWQREFDSLFPYTETQDQLTAIRAIKDDMRRPRPMDRLLCGDVGFGKTELAMRAAFKAVDSGYQVAVLVPTTLLAEQHYHTFTDRLAEFPFEIAKLSRFCGPKEQRDVLEGLASGRIDVVIGTHRLSSQDVKFHNLGLVIIDEEQRFGVEVKERLKSLRTTVDVLTMTATPIPRTLHMSLVGLRDISNLETPPEDRLAVETHVGRFDSDLIRHAVLRELSRGGQIYFVHNRVQDIDIVAKKLRQIVPEASLAVGHGQMPEGELEQVMIDFIGRRFDLLLATTIVESGLDIPNANTIFIDEADRYGLADLHQLRGRVGRYKHRAYCYLLIDPRKSITPNAAKRLRAIEEFSDIGAGFALAMRDLEIRGAGNLLGTQQSGHIATIGYELYCELLENAVRKLRQMPPKLTVDVDVRLPGEAFLPSDYVPEMRTKIDLYRRLAAATTFKDLEDFAAELRDRFGPIPEPVQRMLQLAELKLEAAIWQIAEIYLEPPHLVFRFTDESRIRQLIKAGGKANRLRVVDEEHAYLKLQQPLLESNGLLKHVKSMLRPV